MVGEVARFLMAQGSVLAKICRCRSRYALRLLMPVLSSPILLRSLVLLGDSALAVALLVFDVVIGVLLAHC